MAPRRKRERTSDSNEGTSGSAAPEEAGAVVAKRPFPFPPSRRDPEACCEVLKYEVEGVSDVDDNGKNSPSITIKGLKWYVRVRTETSERTNNETQLSIYIYCMEKNHLDVWYADVLSTIRLINRRDRSKDKVEKFSYRFAHNLLNSGYASFVKHTDAMSPAKGFMVNDKVLIEASITVLKVHGLPSSPTPYNFSTPTENFSDGTLLVGGKKVHVSKQMLALNSPVFEALFFNRGFNESNQDEVTLEGVDHDHFVEMLQVLYNVDTEINPSNCSYILKLADQFQIKSIMKRAESFLCTCYQYPDFALASRLKLADAYNLFDAQHAILLKLTKVQDITSLKNQRDYIPISDTTKLLVSELQIKLMNKK